MKNKDKNKKQIVKILGIGKIDFNFFIELTEEDENDLNFSIESLDSLEKLKFLNEKQEYWDRISVFSSSPLINTFLYLNKVSRHKTFIEFSSLAPVCFSEQEMFLKPIINYVSEHNFLFYTENDIIPFYKTTINISVKKGTQVVSTFNLCLNDNLKTSNNISQNKDKNEEDTMYDRLICDYSHHYLFLDLNEYIDMAYFNVGFSDVLNLLSTIDRYNKEIIFCIYFPNIMSNLNQLNIDALNQLSEIISYSDMVFFEKKEAVAYYNLLSQLNNNTVYKPHQFKGKSQFKYLVENKFHMTPFRRKSVKKKYQCDRIGFIFDDLNVLHILETNKDSFEKCTSKEIKLEVIPKLNKANQKIVEESRRQYNLNKNTLNYIYIGGFLSRFLNQGGYDFSLYVAEEITKRCLELYKLGLEYPLETEFYYVSSENSQLLKMQERRARQEKSFILDCTNVSTSRLNEYNPLFDNNLTSFFNSQVVRKHLNNMGFINSKGFILLDVKKKKKKMIMDVSAEKVLLKDKNIMIALRENNFKMKNDSLEKILHYKSKVLNDPSISKLEMLAQTLKFSPLKNYQLPSYSESSCFYKPYNLTKVKLAPIGKDNYNKTSLNMSYNKTNLEESKFLLNRSKFK